MALEKNPEFNKAFKELGGKQNEKKTDKITDYMKYHIMKHSDAYKSYQQAKEEIDDINPFIRPVDPKERAKEILEDKKTEKQAKAAERKDKKLIKTFGHHIVEQRKLERDLAKYHRHDLSLTNCKDAINMTKAERGWKGKWFVPNRHKLRLTISDWKASAWRSYLEGSNIRKKNTINSELDQVATTEQNLRASLIGKGLGAEILPRLEKTDDSSLYGSRQFEMPRFSHATEDDFAYLVMKRKNLQEGNPVLMSDIRTEMKEFQKYFCEVSEWQGHEQAYRELELRYRIQDYNLITDINRLDGKLLDLRHKRRDAISEERKRYWQNRITNVKENITFKNDDRLEIKERVQENNGIHAQIRIIREHFLRLEGKGIADDRQIIDIADDKASQNRVYADLMKTLVEREEGSTAAVKKDHRDLDADWSTGVTGKYHYLKKLKEKSTQTKTDNGKKGKKRAEQATDDNPLSDDNLKEAQAEINKKGERLARADLQLSYRESELEREGQSIELAQKSIDVNMQLHGETSDIVTQMREELEKRKLTLSHNRAGLELDIAEQRSALASLGNEARQQGIDPLQSEWSQYTIHGKEVLEHPHGSPKQQPVPEKSLPDIPHEGTTLVRSPDTNSPKREQPKRENLYSSSEGQSVRRKAVPSVHEGTTGQIPAAEGNGPHTSATINFADANPYGYYDAGHDDLSSPPTRQPTHRRPSPPTI